MDRTGLANLEAELSESIQGDVLFDEMSRHIYSTDASLYQIKPLGIVLPRTRDEVRRIVQIAAQHQVPLLPRGGGTSLAGQTVLAGLVVDCSKYLTRILEINPDEGWARVEPGIVLDNLNESLKPHNLHFPPDPATSSRANIGGMLGNNSAGTRSIVYGKTIDHVPQIGDDELGPRLWRRLAGAPARDRRCRDIRDIRDIRAFQVTSIL